MAFNLELIIDLLSRGKYFAAYSFISRASFVSEDVSVQPLFLLDRINQKIGLVSTDDNDRFASALSGKMHELILNVERRLERVDADDVKASLELAWKRKWNIRSNELLAILLRAIDYLNIAQTERALMKVRACAMADSTVPVELPVSQDELDSIDLQELRAMAKAAEMRGQFELSERLIGNVLGRIKQPFWEHHFIAVQKERRLDFEGAAPEYRKFLAIAVDRGDQAAIRQALYGIADCLFVLASSEDQLALFRQSIPDAFQNDETLHNKIALIEDALNFRKIGGGQKIPATIGDSIGHRFYSEAELREHIVRLENQLRFNPNFHTHYELSKAYAMLGDAGKGREHLAAAYDCNIFLFTPAWLRAA